MSLLKNPFIAFLKLVRIENLVVIVLTMYVIFVNLVLPVYDCGGTPFDRVFGWLVLSTVLIAAAGYIINDYFDVKTDLINHPETVVIDKVIKRRWAMVLHIVFSGVGLLLGAYVALKCGHLSLVLFQILAIVLLWFYSTHFKKQLLVGNLVVSLLTGVIPMMPFVYATVYSVHHGWGFGESGEAFFPYYSLIGSLVFALFAFLSSFAREIIKDMEDYKGDIQTGCRTMPIEWGIITSKVFTFFLIVIILGLLSFVEIKLYQFDQKMTMLYVFLALILPFLILILMIIRANTSRHFKIASLLLKFIMLLGIITTFLI